MRDKSFKADLTPSGSTVERLHQGATWAAIAIIVISFIALVGWVLGNEVLTSMVPGRVSMKPNTALGLIASGVAVWAWRSRSSASRSSLSIARCLATLILGLGLLTLLEYALGLNFGINQSALVNNPEAVDAVIGGRPAPNTAINFVLTGMSLWLLSDKQYRIAQGLSAGIFFIALLALTGHLYSVTDFYGVGSVTGMAIPTAIAFLLVGLSLLFIQADHGWMRQFSSDYDGGVMMRKILPLIIVLPTVLGFVMLVLYQNLSLLTEGTFALRTVLSMTLFGAVIWWNGRSLNRIDAQRRAMQRQFAEKLEAQVAERTAELQRANQTLQAENARRQQAEASLRRSEAQMQRAIRLAPFPIVMHTEDGQILAISRTLTEITGYTADDIPTIMDWTERAYGDRHASVQAVIDRLYAVDDRTHDGEFEVSTKMGEKRVWDFSSAPLGQTADGQRLVISMAADITERKQMEAALAASRQQLQRQLVELENIYQSAPIGLNVLDTDLRFVRINQRLAEINGLPIEAHLGRTVRELLPDLADTAETLLRPIFDTGEPLLNVEIQGETPARPGVQRIWRENFFPLKEGDRVIGINTVCEEITEQRQTQLALQAAQAQLEVALETSAVYPWRINIPENRVLTNRSLAELFGLNPDEAKTGFSIEQGMQVIRDEDRPQVETALQTAIATGNNYSAEFRICPANGTERWVLSRGKITYDAEANPREFIGVVVDITERKQIELAQRESEARYRSLFETIDDGCCIVDLLYDDANRPYDHRFVEVNPAFERQTGMQEVIGKTAIEVVPEFAREAYWFEQYDRVLHTGESVRFESGSEALDRWFEVQAFRVQANHHPRVAVLFREISARKRAEIALATRAKQQAEVAQIGQQALVCDQLEPFLQAVTERMATVLQVEYCKLLERLPDDHGFFLRAGCGWQDGIVGQAIVPDGHDSQAGYTLLSQAPTVVDHLPTDHRFNGPELLTRHGVISGMSTVIGDVNHHPFGVLGVHTTTQRHFSEDDVNFLQAIANILAETIANNQTQQALQDVNTTLEQRVEERTQQLNDVNQELEAFAYSVSHDLRAPLRAIEGLSRILQEDYGDRLDAPGREYTRLLINAATQLDDLTLDLLDYSRLGRRDIQLSPVNLDVVINNVLTTLVPTFTPPLPHIEVASPLPRVCAQRTVLQQVLTNLVTNAVKFVSPDETPTVHIWAETRGDWVRLWIEDNGIGISQRHKERIFRPFERLHGIEAYPGTGIGLAIVHRGITRMGGQVGVESVEGEGSRFWIELTKS